MTRLEWGPLNPISTVSNKTIKTIQITIKKVLIEAIQNSKAGVMQTTKSKSCIKFLEPSNSRSSKEKEAIMALFPRCIRKKVQILDRLENPSTDKRSELKKKSKELSRNKSERGKDSFKFSIVNSK